MKLPISNQSLHRFAIGGAWFFIIISLLHLSWAMIALVPGFDRVSLYQAMDGSGSHGAVGLTYTGVGGLLLIWLQIAAVAAATIATFLSRDKYRRIGHAVLIGWASLWLMNFVALAGIDASFDTYARTFVMSILLTGTGYRALRGWNTPSVLPSFRRARLTTDAKKDDEFAAESLSSVDAALPVNEYGIASDEVSGDAPATPYQSSVEYPRGKWANFRRSAAPHLQKAGQWGAQASRTLGRWATIAFKRLGEITAAVWRSSTQYLRDHGVLRALTTKTSRA